jgi:hypothetical protein
MSRSRLLLGVYLVVATTIALAQGPKYQKCPSENAMPICAQQLTQPAVPGCTECADARSLSMTPVVINGCVGEDIGAINFKLEGGRLDSRGDRVLKFGGEVDWGDGSTQPNIFPDSLATNRSYHHTYMASAKYYPSAIYSADYEWNGCRYRCGVSMPDIAIISLVTSPECSGRAPMGITYSKKRPDLGRMRRPPKKISN